MTRFLSGSGTSARLRALEGENRALREELRQVRRFLDASLGRVTAMARSVAKPLVIEESMNSLQARDGWAEVELAEDGRLLFRHLSAPGQPILMTLEEAREAMPDWEFKEERKDGIRRVSAR